MPMHKYREDYVQIGKEKGLQLVTQVVPATTLERVNWQCLSCGHPYFKTYRAVRVTEKGCSCQNKMNVKTDSYHTLARQLGIRWVGKSQPRNTKSKTLWSPRNSNMVVEASYAQLSYMKRSSKLNNLLGIVEEHVKTY